MNQFKNGEVAESEISHAVLKSEIAKNGEYNLSGDRYKSINTLSTDYNSVKLGEVCRVINGRAYKQEELLDSGKYPVLRVGNFFSNRGWYYSDLELEEDKFCSEGDLLYAWSASFGPKIWDGEKCIYHYHIWKMEPDEKRINKKFLYHVLNKETEAIKAEGGRGIAMIHITKGGIEQREIPLPPLSVQEALVAEIEGYQRIIDGAQLVVENYKPKIDIDADWEMVELGEVCEITSSRRIFKDEYVDKGIPFYRTKEIVELSKGMNPSLELFISNERYLEIKEKNDIPKQGDILVSAVGTLGISWIVNHNNPFYFKDGNLVWIKNIKENIESIYLKLILDVFIPNQIHILSAGAAYQALTIVKLKQLQIPLPNSETQRQIVAQIEKEQELVNANKQLIELFEQKIKDRIAKVWGEEKTEKEQELDMAAEPGEKYKTK